MSKKLFAEMRAVLDECEDPDVDYAGKMKGALAAMVLDNISGLLSVADNGNRRLLADYAAAKRFGDEQGAYARWLEIEASGALTRVLSGNAPASDEDYLTVAETATILRVSSDVVRDAIKAGALKASAVGSGLQRQSYIVQRSAIAEYLAGNEVKVRKPKTSTRKVVDRKKWDL